MNYVACFTTIPSRIPHIHITLNSLLNQTRQFDQIFICIPNYSVRFSTPYVVPESIANRKDCEVIRCTDYGPATKILGLLGHPDIGPETKIFFCDDDRIYPSDRAELFYTAALDHPDTVICQATNPYWKFFQASLVYDYNSDRMFPAGRQGIRAGWVDIFEGFGGVLVQPSFFTKDVYAIPDDFVVVDDIWLSGHIKSNGIHIWGVNCPSPVKHKGDTLDPLFLLPGKKDRKGCNCSCIDYYQKTTKIWSSIESIQLDEQILLPVIPMTQRLHKKLKVILPLLGKKNVSFPDTQSQFLDDLQLARIEESELEKQTLALLDLCSEFQELHEKYQTSLAFLKQNNIALTTDLEANMQKPLYEFLMRTNLKSSVESYIQSYTEFRLTSLQTSILRYRVLCHGCKQRLFHFISVPCGHLTCQECKSINCSVCTKQVATYQKAAF